MVLTGRYIEDGKLCCTGFLRVQNATIFPKNIHFFATLLDDVAKRVGVPLGEYTHFIILKRLPRPISDAVLAGL